MALIKFKTTCEHGKEHEIEIETPIAVEIMDCAELPEDEEEYAVWLKAGEKHYAVPVLVTPCQEQAGFVADAIDLFLETEEGQTAALGLIQHHLALEPIE